MDSNCSSDESVDGISSLPDGLLLHILSAVLTGFLSRRWRGLWAYTQSLDFDVSNYYRFNSSGSPDDSDDFLQFVDQASSNIHKFRLRFYFCDIYDPFVGKWLLFPIRRGVKQLYLDFPSCWDPDYKLPDWLFRCESLISHSVRGNDVVVPNSVCFSSLLSLTISSVYLNPDSIPILLNGCPLLEDLVLEECIFYGNLLRISSSPASGGLPLKRLTLACNSSPEFEKAISIEIEAPKLEILNLSWFNMYNNSLKNMFSLRQVYLRIPFASPPPGSLPILESWLKELHYVEVLKLCIVCIEVSSATIGRYQPSYLSKTKCLFLESQLRRTQLPGIANLLCRSQDLENLIVKLIPSRFVSLDLKSMEDDFDEEYLEWLKFSFACMVSGLMTVKINGFMGRECVDASAVDGVTARSFFEKQDKEIELVRFFLKNAVALKKMTIHLCGKPTFVEEVEWLKLLPMVAKKLTALPRASSCAELSLVYK